MMLKVRKEAKKKKKMEERIEIAQKESCADQKRNKNKNKQKKYEIKEIFQFFSHPFSRASLLSRSFLPVDLT